ncbi:MAG: NAD(P)/FAD-dependent oxidoreductase [Synergistaceae bacterium]|jgi:glycerol-3-phosphate dehydrogenase|nr:NAD(P)/FAD-dependent oxidoreductase [Synergistaceae bacterium]
MTRRDKPYDIVIVGAGVVGCAVARKLSRYRVRIAVVEKEPDVSMATSCRNSGVLHSGINYEPGTNRARLSVRGNAMMDALCEELKVPIRRIGKLTIALDERDLPLLYKQREQGFENGVPGMEIMNREEMRRIQPGVSGILGLWTPTSAVISPYGLTIALAGNAYANGAEFFLSCAVESVDVRGDGAFIVSAVRHGKRETLVASALVNSAGLHADEVSRMLGVGGKEIYACRGEYFVLDKRLDGSIGTLLYPVPRPKDPGLGIHLTPTVDGNILIGPSADYISGGDREDYATTAPVMETLRREGRRLLPSLVAGDYIRNFSGNRPKTTPPEKGGNADFVIDEPLPGFIRLQGIESPGLTSAPAIAEEVRDLIGARIPLYEKENFIASRGGFTERFAELSMETKVELARADPDYGETVCRCEGVTKREVRDAIENPLGARSLKGIKYRSRAMMGRCQGGFCLPRIARMLREDYGRDIFGYMN